MKALEPETIELIERYANGQASDKETRLVQKLLESRSECRKYHDFFIHLSNSLKQEAVEPPVWLKEKIMYGIKVPNRLRTFVQYASLAACFIAILIFDVLIGNRWKAIDAASRSNLPITIASLNSR